jgi:hypothetical protein
MVVECRVGGSVQSVLVPMPHSFHREISNKCDPNREERHDHKANHRKNGYEQIHDSPPRTPGLANV